MISAQGGGDDVLHSVLPYAGWALVVILVGLWAAKQFFGSLLTELGKTFSASLQKVFGSRVLGRRSIARYRRAIVKNYGKHTVGFRSGSTVEVEQVWVPLQYVDGTGHRQDLAEEIAGRERVVVVGEPGAGKSLLMKHSLLTWATGSARGDGRIPVLVDLHRCNAPEVTLNGLLRDELKRNGVRAHDRLVEDALAGGRLRILFDGLDEVARENQTRVARMIRDFVRVSDGCTYLATYRVAVYTDQLSPEFPDKVAIADFDDAGIRRLLAGWPALPAAEADRFFDGLTSNPQLMRLAGSPLLLTMMLYLHVEVFAPTGRMLPTSRPAFYDDAVEHLLRRDRELVRDDSLSRYEGAEKRAVLQHVALTLQLTPSDRPDRRSIERTRLLSTVEQVATRLNKRYEDVELLVREIVERSQLLVALDSSHYAFRHLTLQEYLAACELRDAPQRLLRYYHQDPEGWREAVRLWCGLTSLDSTRVAEEIFGGDAQAQVLALQCLADATNIDPALADRIVSHVLGEVTADRSNPAIEAALGAVASEEGLRSTRVFDRLTELLGTQ